MPSRPHAANHDPQSKPKQTKQERKVKVTVIFKKTKGKAQRNNNNIRETINRELNIILNMFLERKRVR